MMFSYIFSKKSDTLQNIEASCKMLVLLGLLENYEKKVKEISSKPLEEQKNQLEQLKQQLNEFSNPDVAAGQIPQPVMEALPEEAVNQVKEVEEGIAAIQDAATKARQDRPLPPIPDEDDEIPPPEYDAPLPNPEKYNRPLPPPPINTDLAEAAKGIADSVKILIQSLELVEDDHGHAGTNSGLLSGIDGGRERLKHVVKQEQNQESGNQADPLLTGMLHKIRSAVTGNEDDNDSDNDSDWDEN